MTNLRKLVAKLLRDTADNIDTGASELSDDEAVALCKIAVHRAMSKEQACSHLNLSRSRFDDLVRQRKIPKGRKRVGFKELVWYQDDLDACKKQ